MEEQRKSWIHKRRQNSNKLKDVEDEIKRLFGSVTQGSFRHKIYGLVLQSLWHLLHFMVSLWYFVLETAHMLQVYLISSGLFKKYKAFDLTKLRYLAVVVESEEARETSRIVELLHWLSAIGVKHICLYDMDGVLKKSKETIMEKLGDARSWEEAVEKCLFLDQKQMTLEFASFSDGKEAVTKAANFLCSKYLNGASLGGDHYQPVFTEPDMTSALRAIGCGGTEPNLLLIYGPARCHLGFPAWRMRYTEIVHMGTLKSMKYGAVVKAIYKFLKVKQNYGS